MQQEYINKCEANENGKVFALNLTGFMNQIKVH